MFFGLPLRTTNVTTDPNGMPFVPSVSQSAETLPALTNRVMSGSTEKFTISAGFPSTTPRDWSAEAAYEVTTCTPLPSWDALNTGITLLQPGSGTEYATRVILALTLVSAPAPTTSLAPP